MTAMPPDPAEQLIRDLFDALNNRDLERAVSLYAPQATLNFLPKSARPHQKRANIAPVLRGVQVIGQAGIHAYYQWLLFEQRRETTFELDGVTSTAEGFTAAWHVESQDMSLLEEGLEQLVLVEGRIVQHSSTFDFPPDGLGENYDVGEPEPIDEPDNPQQKVAEQGFSVPTEVAADNVDTPQQQTVVEEQAQTEATASPAVWPAGKCLLGVGGVSAGAPDLQAIRAARAEAVKLPMTARPEHVATLRAINPDIFILVGLYRDLRPPGERPAAYVTAVMPAIEPLYQAGVRYFEIQGNPGSVFDVWQALIGSIEAFAAWFIEVRSLLKAQFPEAQFGFPAVRPPSDPSWAVDNLRFLAQADPAARAADWIGVPCAWSTPSGRDTAQGGRMYLTYRERYPDKLLFITEFANTSGLPSPEAQAREYLEYFHSLRSVPNLGAAFVNASLTGGTLDAPTSLADDASPGILAQVLGARRWGEPGDPPENFAGFAINDRPEGKDELGYDDYARAFVRVLSNPDTKTPLTIGIYGSWGMGKSFLMKRIRCFVEEVQKGNEKARRARPAAERAWEAVKRLRPLRRPDPVPGQPSPGTVSARRRLLAVLRGVFTRPASHAVDFHCVEFNAWVYSGSENLWAGLITHLYNEVEKFLGTRRTVPFRFSHNAQRAARKTIWLLALYGLIGFALSLLLDIEQIETAIETVGAQAATIAGVIALGGTVAAALAALPPLLTALRDLANSLTLARSEQLAALASRRDFRDKIGFMADIKDEIRMIRRLLDQGRDGVRTRLVIFIDDLDRCEPRKAVEVLEAIMLLLADEDGMPFVVVLGIDARIVVKAVEERYGKVLTDAGISGYEYLDKIVQIPFRIPPPQSGALANYVTSLLWRSSEERQQAEAAAAEAAQAAEAARLAEVRAQAQAAGLTNAGAATLSDIHAQLAQMGQAARGTDRAGAVENLRQAVENAYGPAPAGNQAVPLSAAELAPDERRATGAASLVLPQSSWTPPPAPEVTFLPDERAAFEAYAKADHLSANPRRIKRILNIYRVVRLLKPDTVAAQRQQMIKWVVLTEQWPYRTAWLMQAAEDDAQLPPDKRRLKDNDTLDTVYQLVLPDVRAKDAQPFAGLDADPDLFEGFIQSAPPITVADLSRLRPYTFNLNPALQGEVTKAVVRKVSG